MQTKITVTWSAFDRPEMPDSCKASQSITFVRNIPAGYFDKEILEVLFAQTNCYKGSLWDAMNEIGLPPFRTHTALSVGDQVRIERNQDNSLYRCENVDWELLSYVYDGEQEISA
jgi:hypothetical protein